MNEELRALLKEAYDRGANREQLDAIVERYNASKKKEEPIPSESSDGVSASPEIDYGPDSFKQVTGVDSKDQKEEGPTVGQWFGNIYNGLVEGVQDFLYPAAESTGITDKNILSFIEQKQEEYPELYDSYLKSLEGGTFQKLGYEEEKAKELAARTAYSKYWESNNDIENEVIPFIRGERRETAVKEVGVDIPEDIKQELDEQFWNSSLKGLMSSLPAMVASSTTMGGSFVVQSYYSREEEIASLLSENPDLEMSKSQQEAYKITGALVEGALEKVGLSGALKGSPALTKLVTSKVLDKALKSTRKATKETIDRYVNESVQEVLGRVAGGSLAEFETGALQQLSDDALKGLVNTAKGKEFFDPKSLANVFKDALYAGAQEAVGGGVISSAAMLGTSSREQRVREINEEIESLKNKRDASQTEGEKAVVDEVITDLKTELNKEVRDSFKEYEAFSEKDINKITDLNSQIADAAAKYKVAESESLKEKYKEEIIGLRAEKEAIESKYDSKEEERVPSPEQEAEAPVEAEPVAEPSEEEAPADRDVQEVEEVTKRFTEYENGKPVGDVVYEANRRNVSSVSDDSFLSSKFKKPNVTFKELIDNWDQYKDLDNDNINTIKNFIEKGVESPIVLSNGEVVDGNHRLIAANIRNDKFVYAIKQKEGEILSDAEFGPVPEIEEEVEVDQEAVKLEEETIADAEFRIEDLQSEIDIEKGNIKEARAKSKEDIAAVRKSKLSKERKAEKIEELKAELQDTVDDMNGNIGIYKEDIRAFKSDIRKANKRLDKLRAPKAITKTKGKIKEQLETVATAVSSIGNKADSMVSNFNNALKSIGAADVAVYAVSNDDMKSITGSTSRAQFRVLEDGTSAIILNTDKATLGSLSHEMLHAYVKAVKLTGDQIVSFTDQIKTQLSKGNNSEKELAKKLQDFQDAYIKREVYGKGLTLEDPNIAEEFLAEYVAQIKDGMDVQKMSLSTIEKIRKAVAKILNDVLGIKVDDTAIKSKEEAFDFINGFLDALEGRTELTAEVNPEATAVVNSKNPYEASRLQLDVPVGSRIANEPLKDARTIAIAYMESKGLKHIDGDLIRKIDKKLAKRISDAYTAMKDNPSNPEVAAAYKAMADETIEQYEAIIKGGYKVEVNNNEPYNNSNELIEDLRKNKNMRIFSTDSGFGDAGITADQRKNNPLLAETKYKDVNGRTLLVNDVFRFVHDFFGHAERGNGFGPIGEENAWDVHSRMYSPLARKALTSETRGQNSYVNFSGVNDEAFKLRDKGRALRKEGKFEEAQEFTNKAYATMKFAPQKVGLLPDEFVANPYLEEKIEDSEPIVKEQIDAVKIISSETPKQKAKKEAVAEVLNGFADSQLPPNSSEQDLISRFLNNIFEESSYTLKKGARESGMTWYIEDITEFENKMTVLLPELSDPNQMKLFKQVLAITSSGTNPNQNLQTAYTLWVRSNGEAVNFAKNWGEDKISFITKKGVAIGTGIIVRETKTKYVVQKVDALGNPEVFKNGTPKLFEAKKSELKEGYPKPAGFTARGNIVAQQLTKIEKVYEAVGKDINKLIEFFEKPQPVSELRKYNKGVPDVDGNVRKVAVGKRNGAFIFGEKIGAFYQNMIGIGDTITMDLWWSRTWNRYMGTMLSTVDGKKVIQETPRTDRERDVMRKAVTLAAKKLNLDVSELQAVIWYFEQELWTKAGNVSPSFSYVTAVEALNSKIKTDEQTQKRFSEAGADLTAAEKRRQDAIVRADNIIAQGGIQGTVKDQIDWQPSLFGKGQVNPAIVNRATPVQNAALDLLQGKITNAEYQETVKITQPIEAITRFFLPASTKDMQDSLDSNKGKLLNAPLEDGKEIGLRLDIPAYKNRNIWVVSVHDKGKAGKSISYGSVAWATDVKFGSNPKVAAFIAAGQNLDTLKKQDKTTIARMLGKWKNFDGKTKEERDASAVKKVEEIVAIENSYPGAGRKGSPWRQIGMNPFRHSYFYDRRNGKPVIAAAEVVQIGGLVYAKDVVYADKNDPVFEVTNYKDAAGEPVKFQIEDQANEDTANENTYSSVENNAKAAFQSDVDAQVDADVSNTKSWTERPRTVFERFVDLTRLKIQDKFRRLIEIQENIEYSRGEAVGLDEDFRNAETTMHGRAKNKLDKSEEMVADIANKIKKSGLSLDEFNDLLYAMHAQERNRYLRIVSTDVGKSLSELRKQLKMKPSEVAEILGVTTQEYIDIEANKTPLSKRQLFDIVLIYGTTPSRFFYDYALVREGSGMKDTEAREILAKYGLDLVSPDVSQLSPKVRAAVQAVRDLTKDTRDKLVESGLESESTIQVFEETYKNYVPLRGFAEGDVESEIIEGGRKLEVRGREKRAKGRETKADSPLTQAIIANTTTIIRAEKNAVMTKFFNLAKNNPNEDVYEIVDPDITTEYKREVRQGKIITTAKTVADYISDPKMVSIREDGDYKFIRFKDQKLADAFRGANVVKAEFMTKYLGQFNRMLSSFITTYDPEFVLRNFSRDIQTAVLNLYSEQEISEGLIKDKNIVANTVKDTLPSFWSIMKVESGKSSKNKEMDRYYKEFKEDGAKTEWFYSKSAAELQKDIEKLIEGKGESSLRAAANVVERLNSSVENAVRLSSYVNARKAGLPREKAAELAKNLTVNFNKSGEWGQVGNSLFLFFNASTQGTSRLIRSLKPRYIVDGEGNRKLQVTTAQKMAIGLSLLGSLLSVLNEGMSDDDEDGQSFYSKISDFEKERNIIIMKPNGRDYFKIPLPYGVNVFYVAGTLLADSAQKIKTPGEVAGGILEAALGSFSPINFPNSDDTFKFFQKFITPTIGQIPLAIAINENYFGRTIYNENFPGDPTPLPESELGRKGGYRWTKQLTKFLNKATGGSEFRSGAIDINPDRIDFVMESLSGGMGKFVTRSANAIDKVITGNWDELEPRQVPFLRVFYGQTPKYANVQQFYSRYYLVNQMREEVKNGIITGPEAIKINKIYNQAKATKKILSDIKKKEDKAMGIKDAAVQEKRMDALESARYKNVAVFNKMYETLNIDKIK